MNRLVFFLLFIQLSFGLDAQKLTFSQLGIAEKWWALTHPSSAVKAKRLTEKVLKLTDSIAKVDSFPNLKSGGEKDAFRHALWMAILAKEIGAKKALKLGEAHEKTNRKDFKKRRTEEGAIPDSVAERMDLFNNEMGAIIADRCAEGNAINDLVQCVKSKLYKGELRIIKMNEEGVSLDAKNRPIPQNEWEGNWINDRMLVPSNYLLKDQNQN